MILDEMKMPDESSCNCFVIKLFQGSTDTSSLILFVYFVQLAIREVACAEQVVVYAQSMLVLILPLILSYAI